MVSVEERPVFLLCDGSVFLDLKKRKEKKRKKKKVKRKKEKKNVIPGAQVQCEFVGGAKSVVIRISTVISCGSRVLSFEVRT